MPRRKQDHPIRHAPRNLASSSVSTVEEDKDQGATTSGVKPGTAAPLDQDAALDLSVKRPRGAQQTPFSVDHLLRANAVHDKIPPSVVVAPSPNANSTNNINHTNNDTVTSPTRNLLDELSSLVTKVGGSTSASSLPSVAMGPALSASHCSPPNGSAGLSMQDLWWKYMKKEESAELKRMSEAKQIFTCLQCRQSFQTMDQLVKHMEVTQHFTNVPKHYSWSLQYARQKMRQMKMKLKYSERMAYFCHLCNAPFASPVHQHFAEEHHMHNPVQNMTYVQLIGGPSSGSSSDGGRADDARSLTPSGSERSTPPPSTPTAPPADKPPLMSPSPHDGPPSSNDNLLSKMEQLVKNAVNHSNGAVAAAERKRPLGVVDQGLLLPPSLAHGRRRVPLTDGHKRAVDRSRRS